jgi:LysR family transcriptional regulator, glycine cleavage system transcriptional activator
MFSKLPPLHSLTAFECVARHQSFAKAAEELCITHSAVSHRIKQLEDSVGTRLFDRLNRNVALTSAGARFLETVRESLHRLEVASRQVTSGDRVTLRVSARPAIASNWLAYRIADFQLKHPKIDLHLEAGTALADLRSREADVCLQYGEGDWPGCHALRLFTDEFHAACSPEYLRKAGPFRQPSDLQRATLLRTPPKVPWRPWFEAAGLDWEEPSTGPIFGEATVLLAALANGAGVGLAGRIAAAPHFHSGRLVRVFDIGVPAPRSLYAVCLESSRGRPEIALFMEWLASEAREDVFKGVPDPIQQREEKLRVMIENIPAGAILVDGDNLTMNRATEAITGYSREELPTLDDWFKVIFGHQGPRVRRDYEHDRANRSPVRRTRRILRKDGEERFVEFSTYNRATGEVWLLNDVTEREAAQERPSSARTGTASSTF